MNPKTISSWKKTYPWMTWDGTMDNGMKCIECAAAGKTDGAFTDEDGCCVFMVKNYQQHHKTYHVTKATAADAKQTTVAGRSSLGAAAAETGSSAAKTVHAQRLAYMEVAYTTSKQVTSSDHQLKADLDAFDRGAMRLGLSSGATTEYRHHHGAANATMAFSGWLSAKQLERILTSPLIGISCDESTDVAATERMVVYIRENPQESHLPLMQSSFPPFMAPSHNSSLTSSLLRRTAFAKLYIRASSGGASVCLELASRSSPHSSPAGSTIGLRRVSSVPYALKYPLKLKQHLHKHVSRCTRLRFHGPCLLRRRQFPCGVLWQRQKWRFVCSHQAAQLSLFASRCGTQRQRALERTL